MDPAKLQMLQELMKEARTTGQLESSLAATSVFPVPKHPSRKNVPLAEFNRTVASMAKPSGVVQSSGIQAVPKGSTLMADVPASSNAPPMTQGPSPVSTAKTNPETSQGINRMRLAHERGDPIPTVAEAQMQKAKAAIFRSQPMGVLDPQTVAKAVATPVEGPGIAYTPGPGYRPAGYVKPDPPAAQKRNRVTRQPVQLSLQAAIPEGEEEGGQDQKQMPLQTQGAMTDASKRQRSPGASRFQEHLDEFDEWEEIDIEFNNGEVVYTPVLDPTADAAGVGPGPFPPMGNNEEAAIAERHRRANTHCPEDVLSYAEWGRTMVQFGKEMRGESYYAVAHGAEARYVQYRRWARTHLERKSVLGKDFVRYLAVKERYFGTYEDDMFYKAERMAQAKAKAAAKAAAAVYAPTIPGTNQRRQFLDFAGYSPSDDPWNYDLF